MSFKSAATGTPPSINHATEQTYHSGIYKALAARWLPAGCLPAWAAGSLAASPGWAAGRDARAITAAQ